MSGASILVVEDDPDLRRTLVAHLRGRGHDVTEAGDAATALRRWSAGRPDLVVLDLGLPDADGSTVIRRIRREATTPILILSARDREPDKVAALEAGADDYVTKPFGTAELHGAHRSAAAAGGGPGRGPERHAAGRAAGARRAAHRVTVGDREVALTPREFEVLKVLLSHPGGW